MPTLRGASGPDVLVEGLPNTPSRLRDMIAQAAQGQAGGERALEEVTVDSAMGQEASGHVGDVEGTAPATPGLRVKARHDAKRQAQRVASAVRALRGPEDGGSSVEACEAHLGAGSDPAAVQAHDGHGGADAAAIGSIPAVPPRSETVPRLQHACAQGAESTFQHAAAATGGATTSASRDLRSLGLMPNVHDDTMSMLSSASKVSR